MVVVRKGLLLVVDGKSESELQPISEFHKLLSDSDSVSDSESSELSHSIDVLVVVVEVVAVVVEGVEDGL